MLMKYIKYSFLVFLLSFQSCLWQEDDHTNYLSCSMIVVVSGWNKTLNNCNYTITYDNQGLLNEKGYFDFKLKSSTKTYVVHSEIYTAAPGKKSVTINLSNCKFNDEIVEVCFAQYN